MSDTSSSQSNSVDSAYGPLLLGGGKFVQYDASDTIVPVDIVGDLSEFKALGYFCASGFFTFIYSIETRKVSGSTCYNTDVTGNLYYDDDLDWNDF